MPLLERTIPWSYNDWWNAGRDDAMNCVAPRYYGSDMCEEVLSAYITGYSEGTRVANRTVKCANLSSSVPFEPEETQWIVPGLFTTGWSLFFYIVGPAFAGVATLVWVVYLVLWIVGRY